MVRDPNLEIRPTHRLHGIHGIKTISKESMVCIRSIGCREVVAGGVKFELDLQTTYLVTWESEVGIFRTSGLDVWIAGNHFC